MKKKTRKSDPKTKTGSQAAKAKASYKFGHLKKVDISKVSALIVHQR